LLVLVRLRISTTFCSSLLCTQPNKAAVSMSPDPKDARSSDHEPAKSLDSEEEFLISEDLVPSTPKRQSQTVALDFNGLLNPPLLIQTNETQCGGQLWPGGMVLAEYLLQHEMGQLAGKTMFVVRSDVYFCVFALGRNSTWGFC